MAANALVALSTADTMNSNKASTPAATNANSGNGNITGEPSKPTDNNADDTVKPPKQGPKKFTLKLGSRKKVNDSYSEESAKTENNNLGTPRETMAANAVVGSATSRVVEPDSLDRVPTPASKADLESRYFASMLRKGDVRISDGALGLLVQGVAEFVLDQLKGMNGAPSVEGSVQAVKQESPWARLPPVPKQAVEGERDLIRERRRELGNQEDDEEKKRLIAQGESRQVRLERETAEEAAALMSRPDSTPITASKEPVNVGDEHTSGSQELEVNTRIDSQGSVAEGLRQRPTTKKLDQTKTSTTSSATSVKNMIRTPSVELATIGAMDSDKASAPAVKTGSKSETVNTKPSGRVEMADDTVEIPEGGIYLRIIGPLEEDEEDQSKDQVRVQKWVGEGNGHRLDRGYEKERSDRIRAMIQQRLRDKAELLARGRDPREAPMPPYVARFTTSVLEFTFGPTADVEKPVGAGGDRATIVEEPGKPHPSIVMPPHQDSPGAMRPLVQNKAWQDRFNGLIGRTAREAIYNTKLETPAADNQHSTAKKLEQTATAVTSAATNDELLASALSIIDISKTEKPSVSVPKPQNQPSSNLKPSPPNPFYRSDMTLAIAAQNIAAYFREAADWLNFWHISTPASMLIDMSHKPTSTLNRIFCHLRWTAEFLRLGRTGWDLRRLPNNFFRDVLPLIIVTCGKLEKLGEMTGCEGMMIRAWKDAEEVGEMLATVWNVRARDGEEGGREGGIWDKIL